MSHNKNYIREIVNDYCVIDLETTGLSFLYDDILEIGILKVHDNKIIETYNQLINPNHPIPEFITELTGITNEMVMNKPTIGMVKNDVLNFLGEHIIIGHNTSFDLNFIKTKFNTYLPNKYMDTLQFSRKLYPELKQHRLVDMVTYLNLSNDKHRALSDCLSTKQLYDCIKQKMFDNSWEINDIFVQKNSKKTSIEIGKIVPTSDIIDENNFFYQKHCVFTGMLEKIVRKDAMQLVVNSGGILDKTVNKSTNYLILGNNDYCKSIKDGKSIKQKKAEKLKLSGQDIEVIDEYTFYKLMELD